MKTFICPNCGGEVKIKAKVCPHCGSDENTGWSENTYLDGIDLYDDEDYQYTIEREFPQLQRKKSRKSLWIGIVAFVVILVFVLYYVL